MPISFLILSTIITLVLVGLAVFIHNKVRIRRLLASGHSQAVETTEIHWRKSLKHTIVIYLAPTLIFVLPLMFGDKPTLNDAFQAAVLYLALNYLKDVY